VREPLKSASKSDDGLSLRSARAIRGGFRIRHTRAVVFDQSSSPDEREQQPDAPESSGFGALRHYVPQDLLDVSFPVSRRGYDRNAVDAHIERVNRVIAELKVRSSPPAAVRHALDQAEVKVQGLLQAAREAAEEISASARREADENTAEAKAEAVKLVVNARDEADRTKAEAATVLGTARSDADDTLAKAHAEADKALIKARVEADETRARSSAEADERLRRLQEQLAALREQAETELRQIQADIEAVWQERQRLLADIRGMAGGLVELADAAAARLQRQEPASVEDATVEPVAREQAERSADATSESAPASRKLPLKAARKTHRQR
jgi:DivIVA domain-containing protein